MLNFNSMINGGIRKSILNGDNKSAKNARSQKMLIMWVNIVVSLCIIRITYNQNYPLSVLIHFFVFIKKVQIKYTHKYIT